MLSSSVGSVSSVSSVDSEILFASAPSPIVSETSADSVIDQNFDELVQIYNEKFIRNVILLSAEQRRSITTAYGLRLLILRFVDTVNQLGLEGRIRVTYNESGEVHLSDCVWSNDATMEGPDTCHCFKALDDPLKYFREKYSTMNDGEEERLRRQLERLLTLRIDPDSIMDYTELDL